MSMVQERTMRRYWRVYAFHADSMRRESFKVLAYTRDEAIQIHRNLNPQDIIVLVGEWVD